MTDTTSYPEAEAYRRRHDGLLPRLWWRLRSHPLIQRWVHPYWRRQPVPELAARLVNTIGDPHRGEVTSDLRAFRHVDEDRAVGWLKKNGVGRILDVGCGCGRTLKRLEEHGFEMAGITINPEEVERADHPEVHLMDIQADLEAAPLQGQCFDAAISFDCLEHLENPLAGLRNINRLLAPEGVLIAYIPPVRWVECEYHTIVYTPRQMRWLLNLTGFDLERKTGFYSLGSKGVTYYARKKYSSRLVYPGVMH
jgi:SAM-dependent methyltransferase